jgi:ankyrin repeat protein
VNGLGGHAVRYLVEQGADVNANGGEYGNALQAAASEGNQDTVRYLVEQGDNVIEKRGHFGDFF